MLKAQPGEMLFRWKGKDGEDHCLSADGVNAALRERFAETTSAKDFRTFRASSIVAEALQDVAKADAKTRKDRLKHSIKESARFLANTPTVCKASYVHPDIQDVFGDEAFDPTPLFTGPQRAGLTRGETALLRLLKQKAAN